MEYSGWGLYHRVAEENAQGASTQASPPGEGLHAIVNREVFMTAINRRVLIVSFLQRASLSAAFLALPSWVFSLQRSGAPPPQSPPPPLLGQKPEDSKDSTPEHKPDPHALLKENQKNIKRDVERLAELAEELKVEVGKTDSADVLSIPLLRKAEEIEKLAKAIRNRARG